MKGMWVHAGLLCAFVTTSAMAGPFGLEMGTSLEALKKIAPIKLHKPPFVYTTETLPYWHPDFESVGLVVTPQHGLCKIMALGKTVRTSVYGTDLIEKFEKIEEGLAAKYGADKKFDYLRSGSIWNEPKDWTMGLLKSERTLMAYWETKTRPLPDNLADITLEAKATRNDSGYLVLTYEFTNVTECIDVVDKHDNSSL